MSTVVIKRVRHSPRQRERSRRFSKGPPASSRKVASFQAWTATTDCLGSTRCWIRHQLSLCLIVQANASHSHSEVEGEIRSCEFSEDKLCH